jgi:hypothetical protein
MIAQASAARSVTPVARGERSTADETMKRGDDETVRRWYGGVVAWWHGGTMLARTLTVPSRLAEATRLAAGLRCSGYQARSVSGYLIAAPHHYGDH